MRPAQSYLENQFKTPPGGFQYRGAVMQDGKLNFSIGNLYGPLGILGTKLAKSTSVDEQAAQAQAYSEVSAEFPFSENMDCTLVENTIKNIDAKIDTKTQEVATGTTKNVGNRYISAYNQRKAEFVQIATNLNCAAILADQQNQQFLDSQLTQLQKVQDLSTGTSKTATYVIVGVLGLAGIVTLIMILKR